jgi:predicted transposase/invertase (TIGR01784 family)
VSFLIANRLVVLIEHQSTINNNIPLRLLMYIARIYEKIIKRRKRYKNKLEKIPRPEFIVLYNGKYKYPDYKVLKLSDAFKNIEGLKLAGSNEIPLELVVHVYNINHGHNSEILKRSETLDNYSIFIDKIREYQKQEKSLEETFKSAINYCIRNNILKDYLEAHASEVLNMLLGEWDQEEAIEVAREEGEETGREEAHKEDRLYFLELLNQGLTIEEIKERLQQEEKVF